MKNRKKVAAGRKGGKKTGKTKRRGDAVYYAALAKKRWAKKSAAP